MRTRNIMLSIAFFLLGLGSGIAGGVLFSKNKYAKIADKEIESVRFHLKEYYDNRDKLLKPELANKSSDGEVISKPQNPTIEEGDKKDYQKYAGLYNKDSNSAKIDTPKSSIQPEKTTKPTTKKIIKPYVIEPEVYRSSEYQVKTLYWYKNKVLTDDDGNVIHDVDGFLGPGNINQMGKYEEDCVYIRDDNAQIDYEVLAKDEDY